MKEGAPASSGGFFFWVEQIPSGYKVLDANGQALAYVCARETKAEADITKVLTFDEARFASATTGLA